MTDGLDDRDARDSWRSGLRRGRIDFALPLGRSPALILAPSIPIILKSDGW
jgi:hypothetical protein